jgi:2,3-bisphosphoglycerate-independent phosphoglycerate mutase
MALAIGPNAKATRLLWPDMPFYDELREKYPHTLIEASGECVGLPRGVMGNSNVGHLCLGTGRVLRTDVERINHEITTGTFFQNLALNAAMDNAVKHDRALHIMGLLSDGLVHSSQEHAYALLRMAKDKEVRRVFVHCFLDGRDTPPSSAEKYVAAMQERCTEIGVGEIATVVGRYYAMDRDKRWERIEPAYRLADSRAKASAPPILWPRLDDPTNVMSPTNSSSPSS